MDKTPSNKNNGNIKTANIHLKLINFLSIIDQAIQTNL